MSENVYSSSLSSLAAIRHCLSRAIVSIEMLGIMEVEHINITLDPTNSILAVVPQ